MNRFVTMFLFPLILLSSVLTIGCVRLDKPHPQKSRFVLEVPRDTAQGTSLPNSVLLLRNFATSARFQSKNFVYRIGESEYQSDFYHEFFASPSALITEETFRFLQQTNLFEDVIQSGEPPPTHLVNGRIVALYGDYRPDPPAAAVLELQLTLIDDQPLPAKIILDRHYRREIPLADRTPEALVRGWNAALQEILTQFEQDIRQTLFDTAALTSPLGASPQPVSVDGSPTSLLPPQPDPKSGSSVLFPDGSLFEPALANPKEPRFHVTWLNLNLDSGTFNTASVGFGESFGLIRKRWEGHAGEWQFGISGAVFAQFNLDSESQDLINADYIIGLPLSYRNGPWSARARLFHQSSHLGDEFLLLPQEIGPVERINLSFETLELLAGWQWKGFRITAGPSYIIHTDTPLKRHSVQASLDYHGPELGILPGNIFGSLFLHSWEETDWDLNLNFKTGLNLKSPFTGKRNLQFFAEYFNGHLPFGQFYEEIAEYFGIGLSLGL
jgi:hypothetical protein